MSGSAVGTLAHPFAAGLLDTPAAGQRVLFLGATPEASRMPGVGPNWLMVQGFRPDFLELRRAGYEVVPEPMGDGYDFVLVLIGRHRGLNEAWLVEAIRRVRPSGLVVVAGGKTDGIAALRRRVEEKLELVSSVSKYHGTALWFRNRLEAAELAKRFEAAETRSLVDGRFRTSPGMFSHDRVDIGSRLLAECLPRELAGPAADFCGGWGYLSVALGERCAGVASIDLYEADFASSEAARENLAAQVPHLATEVFWHDLIGEPVQRRYDLIVMNPPFHTGRAAEPGLGQSLIRKAAAALVPRGDLFLVANRQLPYEAVLDGSFSRVERLREEQGFKVFRARK